MTTQLKKFLGSVLLLGGLFAVQSAAFAQAAPSDDLTGKNVVLIHGAFADGSSWDKVIPLLEARGLHVVAVQNPLSSLADDVAATRRVIAQQNGPVILVGHSWGGVVLTEAGNDDKVGSLVYVAAFAPDNGESIADITKNKPAPVWAGELRKDSAGYLTLSTQAVLDDFAQDLPLPQKRLIAATQQPWAAGCIDDQVTNAAWHHKPAYFVVSGRDRMIDPALQSEMAKHINAKITRVDTSHVAMLSQPQAVADTIIAAARVAQ
ncbi:alpha/beta hydrolase [Paraburkholderia sprentiae WSM5005]|uniref:Alpha/beta hydrolase n=1 Tax=Paraburkholderia sprentiae WSM5005 TaxID=754502 RepID=A0A1I9YPH4_9BURK|nr:alpha/beta hydrolase [Paraburkholderia sprentiae]APA88207.1 alpha/beta hydrolase [Paraburkholderia sprentiae WSM5005]